MAFRQIDDITSADIALEISAKSAGALFVEAGAALRAVMLENEEPAPDAAAMSFELRAESIEALLHSFMDELLFYKDSDGLLVTPRSAEVDCDSSGARVRCQAVTERIDHTVHRFVVDVKAVTMHRFSVRQKDGRWTATVVLDV